MADDSSASGSQGAGNQERETLAKWVSIFVVFAILALSSIVLLTNRGDDETARYVFGAIVPLAASWMGTILAFYFSRENFVAATQSVRDLTQAVTGVDKLKTIPVTSKMRLLKDITFEQVVPGDEDKKKLSDLVQKFKDLERVLILDRSQAVRFLIYKSMIDKYLAGFSAGTAPAGGRSVADLTLKDLLDSDAAAKKMFETSFAFVGASATLADAKRELERIAKCGDVFVTRTAGKTKLFSAGSPTTPFWRTQRYDLPD
jgi:hypothetical protein